MNRMRALLSVLVFVAGLVVFPAVALPTQSQADTCGRTYTFGVGGLFIGPGGTGTDSGAFQTVNQRIGYNTFDPVSGIRELDRLVQHHRSQCPRDHIKIIGHSEGAAIVHVWVTEHQNFGNANAVLLADPKRVAGPGGPGLSSQGGFLGYPLAGVDDWFGHFPVLTVCYHDDWVCDVNAGPVGYAVRSAHSNYQFDVNAYSDWGSGVLYR